MPLIIKRYIYEALRSIEFANQNNVSELHIIVGCTHERPLEYLLSNRKILNSLKPYI
jgi:hypothetical protein